MNIVVILTVAGIYLTNKNSEVSLTGLAVKEVNQNVDKISNIESKNVENTQSKEKVENFAAGSARIGLMITVVNTTK